MDYMNKIYLVKHCFDVDGGFGDAISQEEVICGFDNREKNAELREELEYYRNRKLSGRFIGIKRIMTK